MSCSMMTIVSCRFSSAIEVGEARGAFGAEAGGRLVEEQQARLGGERDGDLERAPLAVGQAAWRGACSLPARPTRASTAAACSSRRGVGAQVAPGVEALRARTRGSATSTLSSARVVVEQVHDLERARDAAAARSGAAAGR